jgi:hypothetical protein
MVVFISLIKITLFCVSATKSHISSSLRPFITTQFTCWDFNDIKIAILIQGVLHQQF